jgi:hypothetical protein
LHIFFGKAKYSITILTTVSHFVARLNCFFITIRKFFPTKFTQNVHFVGMSFSFWDGGKMPLRASSFSKFSGGGTPDPPRLRTFGARLSALAPPAEKS